MSGLVYIISAPSGSGKSTLVTELRKSVPHLDFSISYTTRKPRGSEQDGREYYFVSREQFERMIAVGEFLEHAEVFGHYYGTARRFLEEAEKKSRDLLLDVDVQGARQVKQKLPQAVSIFVLPPSRTELEQRLRRRSEAEKMKSEDVIQRRLTTAGREIENYPNYDYILINDRLEQSIDTLKAIVLSERVRHSGKTPNAGERKMMAAAERCLQANCRGQLEQVLSTFKQRGN
ncbi:MAG: guanylate kinase [Terriglobales bacterium]